MLNNAQAQSKLLRLGLVTSQLVSQLVIASGAASFATAFLPAAPATAASATAASATALVAAPEAGNITGQVFNDFNANGVKDANEPGVANITVTAFDGSAPVSTLTDINGFYTVTVAGASARVEFTGLPAEFQSSPVGTSSNTSVRFVPAPSVNVNFGIFRPSSYCQYNPQLAVTCFVSGNNVTGPWQNDGSVKTQPYDATGINPTLVVTEALARQTGSVYGLAYQRSSKTIFVSSYTKRIAGYGPGTGTPNSDGTGTIYALKQGGAGATPFVDLDDLFGATTTGVNPHTSLTPASGDFDGGAYAAVGKVALGDLDISEDDSTLWVVNLANRSLYGLPIGNAATPVAPTAAQITTTAIPDPGCANGVGRPFGIKPYNGLIYVGGVCTAEQIAPTAGVTTDLQAYVYAFNPVTSQWTAAPVLQFPLNYTRTCVDLFPGYPAECKPGVNGSSALWRPWRDVLDTSFPAGWDNGYTAYPQPMLTDIEILDNGDMVVSFRDRFADQIGYDDPGPQNNPPRGFNLFSLPAGDILRAGLNANATITGSWTIESNSQSNPPGRFGPTSGANTGEGPGNGEFYHGDYMTDTHDETALGSLAFSPVFTTVMATVFDPLRERTGGTAQFHNTTGQTARRFELYPPPALNTPSSFRKANGLGDIELLCDSAPIEIGNRVWLDSNLNGVQDVTETVLAGVQITLTDALGNSAVATTDANGEYRFSSAAGTSTGNAIYNLNGVGTVALNPLSPFTLTVNLAQAPLAGLTPTLPFADASPNGIARDSNGVLSVNAVRTASVATLTTGAAGANNHTYDFGFQVPPPPPVVPPPAIALTKYTNGDDADLPTGPNIPVGGVVTWTYLITNTGQVTLTDVTLVDNREGLITCPQTTLIPGGTMLCTRNGVAQLGQYANTSIVTGTSQISPTQRVTSTNPSHYFGFVPPVFTPAIALTKYTNGDDADTPTGPQIPVGGAVTWTYLVTNTGNVTLTNIVLSDDRIGPVTCPQTTLVPGGTMLCTANGIATVGQYANVGVVTGTNQLSPTQRVTSTNPSHYFGFVPPVFTPAIALTKYTNGDDADTPTGPQIPVGGAVTWTYLVTNTGNVTLTNIVLSDDRIGPVTCPQTTLVPGGTMLCTANGIATVGQYANTGVVTGTNILTPSQRVTSTNPSHYFGFVPTVYTPAIALTKYTNGDDADVPPGPQVFAGDVVTWTYVVTNTGNVTLTNVVLNDDRIGPITCPQSVLIPGQTMTCTQTGIAVLGQYANMGIVTGTNILTPSQRVTSTNPSHYFAITPTTPALVIVKSSVPPNGSQVTNGSHITYTLTVTNVGSAPATNVIIDDAVPLGSTYVPGSAVPPLLSGPDPLVWNVGTLAPGQSTQVSFSVSVNQLVTVTAIENQAFVRSDQTPRRPSNRIIHPLVPTAVTLTDFRVQPNGNGQGLKIRWQTGSEINTFGFAIYRSTQADGADSVLVTAQLIPALGAGTAYSADDTAADVTQHYYYWLVEAEVDGQLIRYSPAQWQPSTAGTGSNTQTNVQTNVSASPLGGGVPVGVPIQVIQPSQPGGVAPQQALAALASSNGQSVTSVNSTQAAVAPAVPAVSNAQGAVANEAVQPAQSPAQQPVQPMVESAVTASQDQTAAVTANASANASTEAVAPPQSNEAASAEAASAQVVVAQSRAPQVQAQQAAPQNPTTASPAARPMWSFGSVMAGLAVMLGLMIVSALSWFGVTMYRAHRRR